MINWKLVPDFSVKEFSEDPDKYADPEVIYNLQRARLLLNVKIFPSPVSGALARINTGSKTSQHYTDSQGTIKSKAIDFFCEGNCAVNTMLLLNSRIFKRFGVYFDTKYDGKKWVMFHGDNKIKSDPLFWYRDGCGVYHYPTISRKPGELIKIFHCLIYRRNNYLIHS